jgi:hypothetical protein
MKEEKLPENPSQIPLWVFELRKMLKKDDGKSSNGANNDNK